MNTPAPSFFIESSSFLQVAKTCIHAWVNLNFDQIPPPTTGIAALERQKIKVKYCEHSSAFMFDSMLFILKSNKDNYKSFG